MTLFWAILVYWERRRTPLESPSALCHGSPGFCLVLRDKTRHGKETRHDDGECFSLSPREQCNSRRHLSRSTRFASSLGHPSTCVFFLLFPPGAGALAVSSGRSSSRSCCAFRPTSIFPPPVRPLSSSPSPPFSRVFARLTSIAFPPPSQRWSSTKTEDMHPLSPSSPPSPWSGQAIPTFPTFPTFPTLSMIAPVLGNRPFASGGQDGFSSLLICFWAAIGQHYAMLASIGVFGGTVAISKIASLSPSFPKQPRNPPSGG